MECRVPPSATVSWWGTRWRRRSEPDLFFFFFADDVMFILADAAYCDSQESIYRGVQWFMGGKGLLCLHYYRLLWGKRHVRIVREETCMYVLEKSASGLCSFSWLFIICMLDRDVKCSNIFIARDQSIRLGKWLNLHWVAMPANSVWSQLLYKLLR